MAKPIIRWKPVAQNSHLAGKKIYLPMVVERTPPADVSTLIERAIDTGRIAGLKPSAARGIAEATCEMIAQALANGEGVKFGEYFAVRMYLGGRLETPDAPLTEENPVHARIITGRKLKIDRTQYTFRNVEADGDEQPSTGDAAQPADGE